MKASNRATMDPSLHECAIIASCIVEGALKPARA
jgi:hypothetical protein